MPIRKIQQRPVFSDILLSATDENGLAYARLADSWFPATHDKMPNWRLPQVG